MDDEIQCAIGGCGAITGDFSFAAIFRSSVNGTTGSLISLNDNATTARVQFHKNASNQLSLDIAGSVSNSAFTVLTASGWHLVSVTKRAGTQTPRFMKYPYATGAYDSENGSAALGNPVAATSQVKFGHHTTADPDFLSGDLLVAGVWDRELLDPDEVNALAFSLHYWLGSAPRGLWLLDQDPVRLLTDMTGLGANEQARTGTAVATNHPVIFNRYGSIIRPSRQAAAAAAIGHRMALLGVGR